MKFLFMLYVAAITLVATVSAIPVRPRQLYGDSEETFFTRSAPLATSIPLTHSVPSTPVIIGRQHSDRPTRIVNRNNTNPESEDSAQTGLNPNPLVQLYKNKEYEGLYYPITFGSMISHVCVNINDDINSIKLHDVDTQYWCRIYERLGCEWEGNQYADLPGETDYNVNDLKKRWNHKLGSLRCYAGRFQVESGKNE